MNKEFWCVEVKSGVALKIKPGDGKLLHLTRASLGELKKDMRNESVYLFVDVDGKKLVLGELSTANLPRQQFSLIVDRDLEVSHSWKNGIVYFYGYRIKKPPESEKFEDEERCSDKFEDEDAPLTLANNGQPVVAGNSNAEKHKANSGKKKVQIEEPNKDVNSDEDAKSSDKDLMFENNESGDKCLMSEDDEDESSDNYLMSEDDSDDSEDWKAYAKTPTRNFGSLTCKGCNRRFGFEQSLISHYKAKHGGGN